VTATPWEAVISNGRHILILVENLPVPFDRRVWQEARALVENGYAVSVICPMGKGHYLAREIIDGIHIYRHHLREARSTAGYAREYASALFHQLRLSFHVARRQRIDAIQACNPPDLMFLVALVHKILFRTSFVFDHHDLGPELFAAKYGRQGLLYKAMQLFERLTFRSADASIATNETFRDIAIARGGMSPERVTVVKSYPEITKFRRGVADPGLAALNRYVVGYVGIMGAQDGVETLVRAMSVLRRQRGRDDVHCVIIGDGPELSRLRALAAELEVDDVITFTGYLSGAALTSHLSAVDVGVIPDPPNEFNDKLSMNKVFEYMMLGLPFVQFDLKQTSREAREAALVVDHSPDALATGIIELIDDPARRERMGRFGLATAQREFQWSVEQTKYVATYQSLLRQEQKSDDQRNRSAPRPRAGAEAMPRVTVLSREGDRTG
jgi:glycosyltransferase involved in cell wall biosynthesis